MGRSNGGIFTAYVREVLVPTLAAGDLAAYMFPYGACALSSERCQADAFTSQVSELDGRERCTLYLRAIFSASPTGLLTETKPRSTAPRSVAA